MSFLAELFRAEPIRRLERAQHDLYLTFDDGPCPVGTPKVLDLLRAQDAKATFFLVAEKARAHPDLVRRIRDEGHTIGNHSLDHRYRAFFGGRRKMLAWVDRSLETFNELGIKDLVGFRPPNGIVTPELNWALRERDLPLVLWSERFYDTFLHWTISSARHAVELIQPGAVILLHDRKGVSWLDQSGASPLTTFISSAEVRGFRFQALTRELCRNQI